MRYPRLFCLFLTSFARVSTVLALQILHTGFRVILPLALSVCTFASEPDRNNRVLNSVIAQLKNDSPVIAKMVYRITENRHNLYVFDEALPGDVLAITKPVGPKAIYIIVDVDKVTRMRQSLIATVLHEITHADDIISMGVEGFKKMVAEDKSLPWGDRRMERRAVQRTGVITAYLAMQYPDRYRSSVPMVLE